MDGSTKASQQEEDDDDTDDDESTSVGSPSSSSSAWSFGPKYVCMYVCDGWMDVM